MIIGIPKEIKDSEHRVGIVPAGVKMLHAGGHRVLVQAGAGLGSGITDEEYAGAGAEVVADAATAWAADLIIKVKEPQPSEFGHFRPGKILYTYLHLAAEPDLAKRLAEAGMVAVAYETVQLPSGGLPLLTPMSEVAGRMAAQIGAHYLERHAGGAGVLLGGVPGVASGHVAIVGGGVVGLGAAKVAIGMGAQVTVLDINIDRLSFLDDLFFGRVTTLMSNEYNIAAAVQQADLVIGAVLIPGAKAPRLVTEAMVRQMRPGSVIVDVAIDQGGSVETMDHVTSHSDPVFIKHGVLHYSVPNIPGAVARTSTFALTNATMPYAGKIADLGWERAALTDKALGKGVNVACGKITHAAVAEAVGMEYVALEKALQQRS